LALSGLTQCHWAASLCYFCANVEEVTGDEKMRRLSIFVVIGLLITTVSTIAMGFPACAPLHIDSSHQPVNEGQGTPDDKPIQTRDVIVTRVFSVPVERVWRAWSQPQYVMRWWGPKGFTAPLARMDFREGGTSLVCMRAPKEFGGQDMYTTWSYRKIVPHKQIEFILNFTDKDGTKLDPAKIGLPAGVPQDVRHVITFKTTSNNRTEMTVTEYGYTSNQAHDLSKAGLEECLDKMAAALEEKK
jgi:uncharacterized protein YndB with AHSA1/START domain